ncbi:hypothetical protein K438DRAFT_2030599, partial [Mycena galopus ATCC 62051]
MQACGNKCLAVLHSLVFAVARNGCAGCCGLGCFSSRYPHLHIGQSLRLPIYGLELQPLSWCVSCSNVVISAIEYIFVYIHSMQFYLYFG